MARFKAPSKLPVYDGTGTKSARMMTGHGAPLPGAQTMARAQGMRDPRLTRPASPNKPGDRIGRGTILPNNWGATTLRKMTAGSYTTHGQVRFVQPTLGQTATISALRLGAPPDRTGLKG